MPNTPVCFTLPKSKPLQWLVDAGKGVPSDVRTRLIANFFSSPSPLIVVALADLTVNLIAFVRHPNAFFMALVTADAILLALRATLLLRTRGAVRNGKVTTPDLFLVSGIVWTALLGSGSALCVATLDPVLLFLSITSTMGIVSGIVSRNNFAPRLAFMQVALCVVPMQTVIPFLGEPLMMISFVICPLFLAGMMKTITSINGAYLAMMMAKRDSEERASHDALTGLWNRSGLMSALSRATSGGRAGTERIALLYVDLDGFKAVNDLLGHAAGDDLIRQAAARISGAVPANCLVARLGGDEFIIVVPVQDRPAALAIGDAVIEAVSRPYEMGALSVPPIGASIGIACSDRLQTSEELLAEADAALYQAKNAGKGQCVLAAPAGGGSVAKPLLAA